MAIVSGGKIIDKIPITICFIYFLCSIFSVQFIRNLSYISREILIINLKILDLPLASPEVSTLSLC